MNDPKEEQQKNDRRISTAWGIAALTGSVTLVIGLFALFGAQIMPGLGPSFMVDGVLILGLGFGLYKRSRICAVALMICVLLSLVNVANQGGKIPPLQLIFAYFYFRGMLSVFAYRRQLSQERSSRNAEDGQTESWRRVVKPAVTPTHIKNPQPKRAIEKPCASSVDSELFAAHSASAALGSTSQNSTAASHWKVPR